MALKRTKILANADKFISQQKYDKALNEYLKLIKVSPNDPNLLNKAGDLYSKIGNKKSAISYFERVAESYHRGGFYPKAIAVYKKISRLDPEYMESREKLVDLYVQQGHHSEAKAELKRMADFYNKNNLPARALAVYERLVKIDPANLDARLKLTEILIREGKSDQASVHFLDMGRELIEKNMINEARKILTQATKFAPNNVQVQVLLAKSLIAEGNIDDAIKFLTDICNKNPEDLQALDELGRAYLQKDMLDEANTCFLRAIHLDSEHIHPLEEVANKFIEKKQLDQAYAALVPVSSILVKKKQTEEATRLFRSILYVDEKHADSLQMLIDIYQKSGQTSNAILTYEKIINNALADKDLPRAKQYIEAVLDIDPDNLEWRTKLESIGGDGFPSAPQEESAVFDITSSQSDLIQMDESGDSALFSLDAPDELDIEPDDPATLIQNHMTEAEVFVKYGIVDQALTHLLAVLDLDVNHVGANQKLKEIYLERNEIDKAVACLTNLANIAMERGETGVAEDHLAEAEKYKPGVARVYRGKLEEITNKEMLEQREDQSQRGFDLGFMDGELGDSPEDLVFDEVSPDDVVDFGHMNEDDKGSADDGDGWSLDIPSMSDDESDQFDFDLDVPDSQDEEELLSLGGDSGAHPKLFEDQVDDTEILPDIEEPERDSFSISDMGTENSDEFEIDSSQLQDDNKANQLLDDEIDDDDLPPLSDTDFDLDADGLIDQIEDESTVEAATPFPEDISTETEDRVDTEQEALPIVDEASAPRADAEDIEPEQVAEIVETSDDDQDDEEAEVITEDVDEPDGAVVTLETETEQAQIEEKPAAEIPALPEVDDEALNEDLEEIDFFLSMEAFEDAINLINEARERYGDQQQVMERLKQVESASQEEPAEEPKVAAATEAAPPKKLVEEGTGFFDLAAELQEELFDEVVEVTDATSQEEIQSVDELFEEFKKGVAEQIDEDDFETHYDLGIAYKEMGLLEESVQEFKIAQEDTTRFMECTAMIGACLIEMGRFEDAIAHYKESLSFEGAQPRQYIAIRYELGLAYEGQGELELALSCFREIQSEHQGYRDVDSRIAALV